jgi:hypothetical protein
VLALERVRNPMAVVARSWRLTRGNSLRLFLFYLLIGVAYVAIALVLGMVLMGISALMGPESGQLLVDLVGGIIGAVASTVMVAAVAASHRQLAGPATGSFAGTFG